MPSPLRLGLPTRIATGVLGALALLMGGFLSTVVLLEPDGVWARQEAVLGLAFGALFLYAAIAGRSPRWLEQWIGGRTPPAAEPEVPQEDARASSDIPAS